MKKKNTHVHIYKKKKEHLCHALVFTIFTFSSIALYKLVFTVHKRDEQSSPALEIIDILETPWRFTGKKLRGLLRLERARLCGSLSRSLCYYHHPRPSSSAAAAAAAAGAATAVKLFTHTHTQERTHITRPQRNTKRREHLIRTESVRRFLVVFSPSRALL